MKQAVKCAILCSGNSQGKNDKTSFGSCTFGDDSSDVSIQQCSSVVFTFEKCDVCQGRLVYEIFQDIDSVWGRVVFATVTSRLENIGEIFISQHSCLIKHGLCTPKQCHASDIGIEILVIQLPQQCYGSHCDVKFFEIVWKRSVVVGEAVTQYELILKDFMSR